MSTPFVRILGIDPGSRITGFGVIESDGKKTHHIASGCIRASGDEFTHRLKQIYDGIAEVVATHNPEHIAVEQVFVHKSVTSALKLGQARGAALAAALARSLPVHEYAPTAVKRAVTGQGHAEKIQVQHMVKLLTGLRGQLNADQADALAIALCHAHHASAPAVNANESLRPRSASRGARSWRRVAR